MKRVIISSTLKLRAKTRCTLRFVLALILGISDSLKPAGAAVVFTNIVFFNGTNGSEPSSPLVQVADGSFYGTSQGSAFSGLAPGNVFHLSESGVLNTVGSFSQTNGDNPLGPFARTIDGTIYGTTSFGGSFNRGTAFRMTLDGTIETLLAFDGTNGAVPIGLIVGPDGGFYGWTHDGGIGFNGQQSTGYGTIFRIDTNGVSSILVPFNGTNGMSPELLILGKDGVIYGITHSGGVQSYGGGTVFKMALDGTLTTLFSFNGTNGAGPSGLAEGTDGKLYGVTGYGGSTFNSQTPGNGIAFCLTKDGVLNKLTEFPSTNYDPALLIQGVDGNFYGGTLEVGSIFQLSPSGTLNFIHTFSYGVHPAGLTRAADNSIYGTAPGDGPRGYGYGSIFRLIFLPDPPLLQSVNNSNGALSFTWNAYPGRSYQVQTAADLSQSAWTNLGGSIPATNSVLSFSDTVSSGSNSLYRVVLLP